MLPLSTGAYDLIAVLSNSSATKVYKGLHVYSGKEYAIKTVVGMPEKCKQLLYEDFRVLKRHPMDNILKIIEIYEFGDMVCIVMEYCSSSLVEYIHVCKSSELTEGVVRNWIWGIVSSLRLVDSLSLYSTAGLSLKKFLLNGSASVKQFMLSPISVSGCQRTHSDCTDTSESTRSLHVVFKELAILLHSKLPESNFSTVSSVRRFLDNVVNYGPTDQLSVDGLIVLWEEASGLSTTPSTICKPTVEPCDTKCDDISEDLEATIVDTTHLNAAETLDGASDSDMHVPDSCSRVAMDLTPSTFIPLDESEDDDFIVITTTAD
mmetsp:Transcript_25002/g.36919  ORF Transcript_25002/g.36919 Transcript_25002/m.36919 type:complete len:320 (+) Transcript_25002:87-1046(+)